MCMGSKPAPAPTPAPAPPPPTEGPQVPVIDDKLANQNGAVNSNRIGRNALRIDLAGANTSGGSGLAIGK